MDYKTVVAGVLMDENSTISFVEVCQRCNISKEALEEMMDHGLFNDQQIQKKEMHFDVKSLLRIQSACRLQQDLGINLPGVVLVLELLDELEQVRNELKILHRHVGEDTLDF